MQDLNHPLESLATESQENPSLDQLIKEFAHWRANKAKQSSPIPDELWKKIFILADTYSGAKMRALLGISSKQYRNKYEQFHGVPSATKPSANPDLRDPLVLKMRKSHIVIREFYVNRIIRRGCIP